MTDGKLTLVATPIGNLDDMSPRGLEALRAADVVACEDTRRTGRLLAHFGISGPRLVSVRDANEAPMARELVKAMRKGKNVALVTDAGTPAISDPGYKIVAAATGAGLDVTSVPGPSAAITALTLSALPTARFVFEGFLPRKGKERSERLAAIAAERRTTVLYEAPHRLVATLEDLHDACGGDRVIAVARELTKLHEEVWRGQLRHAAGEVGEPRGEYVLVLGGALPPEKPTDDAIADALAAHRAGGEDRKTAVAAVAAELGAPRRRVYELSLSSAEQDEQT